MKFSDQDFLIAASKGQLGQLKAMYILKPEVLRTTSQTSGGNALDLAVEQEQQEVVQWLMNVGAQPTDPTSFGSLVLLTNKMKLSSDIKDTITVDDMNLLLKRAFAGLDWLDKNYGTQAADIGPEKTFSDLVQYFKSAAEDVYFKKNVKSLDSLYVFVNSLQTHILLKINYAELSNRAPSKEQQFAFAWIGLLGSVAVLDFMRVHSKHPSFAKALELHSLEKSCSAIQLMLSDYEQYAIEHAVDADVIALEHASVQAHQAHAVVKVASIPEIIYPPEAVEHINRLNQQAIQSKVAFHARVLAAKDHEGTLQSTQSVRNQLVLAAMQIKKGELPRTQFIVYVGKNSHALTIDLSWNKQKQRFEVISFDTIAKASQQLEFLDHFKSELDKQKCDVVMAACNTELQKDYVSCVLYAIKLALISAKLTFSQCLAMKDPATKFGKIISFNVHHLGEKVIRMGQSETNMRSNLSKIYPDQPEKVTSLVRKYDAAKRLDSMRRKTAEWKAMQGLVQKMDDLHIADKINPALVERAKRIEKDYDNLSADLQMLLRLITCWQESAKQMRDKFEYQQAIERHSLALSSNRELLYQGKRIVRVELLQYGITKERDEFVSSSNRLILIFADKSTQIYELSGSREKDELLKLTNKSLLTETCLVMQRLGSVHDDGLYNISHRYIVPWTTYTFQQVNNLGRSTNTFYDQVHLDVAKRIVKLIESKEPVPKAVTLFAFGCGDGKELQLPYQKLTAAGIVVKGFGFDINPENFRETASRNKTLTFQAGDLLDLERSISDQPFNPRSLKIGLFIGVITDGVLKGTVDALKVVQQTRELDYLYIEGWNRILLNKETLKAVGFKVEVSNVPDNIIASVTNGRVLKANLRRYELCWMSDDERVVYLQRKSTKRSRQEKFDNLDLSFSANPLRDLKLFRIADLKNIRTIDLSWSYLKGNEVDEFFKLLAQIETERLILVVSSVQITHTDIIKAASAMAHVFVHKRTDAANNNEIPAFTPTQARSWGIYEQLPNTPLKRLKN